jgi:hypothetical protein
MTTSAGSAADADDPVPATPATTNDTAAIAVLSPLATLIAHLLPHPDRRTWSFGTIGLNRRAVEGIWPRTQPAGAAALRGPSE